MSAEHTRRTTKIQALRVRPVTQSAFFLYVRSSVSAEMPLIDREQEVSSKPAPAAAPVEAAPEVPDVEVAPPKPPLPEAKMAELR